MANALLWGSPESEQSYLTTELNSLANAGNKLGAAITNGTAKHRYMALEINIATQGSARVAGAHIAVYLIPAVDGTNYAYGADATDPSPSNLLCTIALDASTTARLLGLAGLEIPPFNFKLLIENNTGQALASSGNTVTYRRYSEELQ